ncbi:MULTISPECIES: SulP family inorganic anion transporter [Yersinia]|uniref:SulP family inorganic anion transporter n=1 Tax=Yersinia TaxID=629 RepID=UPI0005DF5442|nr:MULTISPECIES: SulP family inorganic anion transporter [Yersinia]RXA95967.1 SulP family inorganic anion transporter [Yersinia sp. 2105 StPb PI]CNI54719.1 putative sulfate permease [Yersinia frederiksenii]CNK33449.1 putative sulfate permease [Yersinia frederiksenii]
MQLKWTTQWIPGLATFIHYDKAYLKPDIRSGLSVAAVALPTAIAYTELMGINAIIGLYACILPMIVYALFGTSRQLIVGPDAATCAVITAAVAPLALGNQDTIWQMAIIMTMMTGFWCVIAGRFRLAIFADFLSQPILQGLLNGVAITIMVGQIGNILGLNSLPSDLIKCLIALPGKLSEIHELTLVLSITCLAILFILKVLRPKWPGPLIVMTIATLLSWYLDFNAAGITIIGSLGQGLPHITMPHFDPILLRELVVPSLNLAVISIVSFMMTVQSFASKNGYEVDIDQELRALGYINIAAGLSQGFAVSAATSRTAVNDANGGKSQMVSIVAALTIALVLLFLTQTLSFIPLGTLGAVLIYAAWSMFSFKAIFSMRKHNRSAYILTVFTLIAVLVVGLIDGIGFAIILGILQFLRTVFKPTDQLLGVDNQGIIHSVNAGEHIKPIDGLIMYRFNSILTYFNSTYFKKRVIALVNSAPTPPRWVVIDAATCFTYNDASVFAMLKELIPTLKAKGVTLILAGRDTELTDWLTKNDMSPFAEEIIVVPDLYLAVQITQKNDIQTEVKRQKTAIESAQDV